LFFVQEEGGRMSNQKIDLEPFLKLFDHPGITLFPRKSMGLASRGQIVVNSLQELYQLIEASSKIDIFMATHTVEDKTKGLLYLVFLDLDFSPNDLNRARKVLHRILHYLRVKYDIDSYAQFSGSKGYHILIPLEPITVNPSSLASDFLKFLQLKLSMGYCDPQLLGDIVRLVRLPNTYNSKAIKSDQDGLVKVIQEWDGKRLDTGLLWEEFRLKKLEEELSRKEKKPRVKTAHFDCKDPRPCIAEALQHPLKEGNGHLMRLAIAAEYLNMGWAPPEIAQLFQNQSDYSYEKSLYFVKDTQKRGYKPFKCKTIQQLGYCLPDCRIRMKLGIAKTERLQEVFV
jgi:hypothetical protein